MSFDQISGMESQRNKRLNSGANPGHGMYDNKLGLQKGVREVNENQEESQAEEYDEGEQFDSNQLLLSETDLGVILRKRLEGIEEELSDFDTILRDFAITVDDHVQNFTNTMGRL